MDPLLKYHKECSINYKKMKLIISHLLFLFVLLASCGNNKNDSQEQEIPKDAIVAKKISTPNIQAHEIPDIFAANKLDYHAVSVINWPEQYPYLPKVDFAIAHNGDNLLIHYRVTEKRTIGTMENDLDAVYKESCCEFFCMPDDGNDYYNIESNCLGSILMECGKGRSNRVTSTADNLKQIQRWASLGRKSVGTITSQTHWELALVVPVTAFWKHNISNLSGKTFLANVYNCVGSGDDRQYVTWHPITSDAPDFHRPEFFKPVYFEK